MTCDDFRSASAGSGESIELEHLRSCDDCMNYVANSAPDELFRSIGGDELVPPGGVEEFVADVSREIQRRERLRRFNHGRSMSSWSRWSAAAAVMIVMLAWVGVRRHETVTPLAMQVSPVATRSVIESYDNRDATIVEMTSQDEQANIVMVVDSTLPADL